MAEPGGFNRTIKVLIGLFDVLVFHLSFIISFLIRYGEIPRFNYSAYQSAFPYIALAFVFINIFSGIYVLYNKKLIDLFSTTFISQVMMSVVIMAMTFFGRWFAFPRTIVFINLFVSAIFLFIWRALILRLYHNYSGVSRVMILGSEEDCRDAVQNFKTSENSQYKVEAVAFDHFFENIKKNLDKIDVFYLINANTIEEEKKIITYLTAKDKRIFLGTKFENIVRLNNRIMNIDDESLIAVSKFEISPEDDTAKRFMDILISIFLIVITLPIMLGVALLIKLTSKGPILYKQVRVTKENKEFKIYKFRSMRTDAETISGPVLADADDPRITPIGRYLRSLRLDELPQLFNVLKGEMSLIGPRPERPFFVNQFQEENPYYYLRHTVRAGITGYAQVYGKYSTDFNSKLKFDLIYIKNYSIIMDIKILFQTVKILFDKVSSQGLEEEMTEEEIFEDINIYN